MTYVDRYFTSLSVARVVRVTGLVLMALVVLDQTLTFPNARMVAIAVGSDCQCADCKSVYPLTYRLRVPSWGEGELFGTYTGMQGPLVFAAVGLAIYLIGRCIRVTIDLQLFVAPPPSVCATCGYSREGLAADAMCQECGEVAQAQER